MSQAVIRVEKLGKQYRIGTLNSQRYATLRDSIAGWFQSSTLHSRRPH